MLYFGSIVFISFALLIDFCQPVFLAYPVARASTTGLPRIDDATHKLFHENGFHGELVRRAGKHERQCGVVLLDYEKYTEGKWFESILQPYEETLGDAAESPQAKVFSALKKQAVREHKEEVRALFEQYRNSTPLHYDEVDMPKSGASAGTIKKDMYHDVISMLRTHAEQEQQKRRIWDKVVATRTTELHDIEELVEVELSLSRYGLLFSHIRTQLYLAVDSVLTELFRSGQPISHNEYSVLSGIAELMGEKNFKASALKKRYIAAGQTLKATVLSMNHQVMEVEICYPTTKEEDMGYLMQIVSLGQFSDDGKEYARHELGAHYLLPSSMLITNLSLLEKVDVERDCTRMGPAFLCKTTAQVSSCNLDREQRSGCAVQRHDSTDPEFALVEPLIRTTVIATRLKKIYCHSGKEDEMKTVHIEKPVIAFEIPQGMTLYVGEKIAKSQVMTESTAELNITVPEFKTQGVFVKRINHPRWMWSSEDIAICFLCSLTVLLALCSLLGAFYLHRQLRLLTWKVNQHRKLMDARREPVSLKML